MAAAVIPSMLMGVPASEHQILDPNNSIAKKAKFLIYPSIGCADLVSGVDGVVSAGCSNVEAKLGASLNQFATNDYIYCNNNIELTNAITIVFAGTITANGGWGSLVSRPYRAAGWGGPYTSFALIHRSSSARARLQIAIAGSATVADTPLDFFIHNEYHCYIVRRAANNAWFYRDGVLVHSVSNLLAGDIDPGEFQPVHVGNRNYLVLGEGTSGLCNMAGVFEYLNDDEIIELSKNLSAPLKSLTLHEQIALALIQVSAVDSASVSLTDTTQTIAAVLLAADSISTALADTSTNQLTTQAADALTMLIDDVAAIFSQLVSTDGLNLSTAEVVDLAVTLAANDQVSVSTAEGLTTIASAIQLADVFSISVNDSLQEIFAALLSADVLVTQITDAAAIAATLSASDSVTLGVSGIAAIASAIQLADVFSISVNDSLQEIFTTLLSTDVLATQITEAAAIAATLSASDSVALGVSGIAAIASAIQLSDSCGVSLADAVPAVFALLQRSDEVAPTLIDAITIAAQLSRSDVVDISAPDQAQILTLLQALDALSISVADAATRQAIGTMLAKLSAKLRIYPILGSNMNINPTLSAKPKVNND